MLLQAFTPLITSLTLSVVCVICARSHHQASDEADTFTISPVVGYMLIAVGFVFCIVPFLPGVAGNISETRCFWYFSPFWLFAFAASAYCLRYRVVVRDATLSCGAFRRRVVPFTEIMDFDVLRGQKSSELWVYLRSGTKLKFSGMLGDFDELVGLVNSHMVRIPGPVHDSAAKLCDQQKRKRDNRIAGWLTYIGIGIVALTVLILWRMDLLR